MKQSKKVATAKKSTRTSKKSTKKASASVQRTFLNPEMKIVKKVARNPRREGSWGHQSFSLIKNGITVEQYTAKGGRLRDLHWDIQHGNVELKTA